MHVLWSRLKWETNESHKKISLPKQVWQSNIREFNAWWDNAKVHTLETLLHKHCPLLCPIYNPQAEYLIKAASSDLGSCTDIIIHEMYDAHYWKATASLSSSELLFLFCSSPVPLLFLSLSSLLHPVPLLLCVEENGTTLFIKVIKGKSLGIDNVEQHYQSLKMDCDALYGSCCIKNLKCGEKGCEVG